MPALDVRLEDAPAVVASTDHYVFAIKATIDPQVMLRIAGLFAQRHVVPRQLNCRTVGAYLLIDVEVELESPLLARRLLERARSIVLVERANLVEGRN